MTMFKAPNMHRVPKWAWIAAGGAAGAGLLIKLKNKTPAPADPSAEGDSSGAIGYTDAQNMPGIIVAPAQPVATGGGDDGGAMGSMYIGALGDILAGLQDQNSQLLGAVLSTGGGVGGGSDPVGGIVTTPPITGVQAAPPPTPTVVSTPTPTPSAPAPAPAPAPSDPCTGMQAGGSAGACSPAGAICRQMLKCDTNSNGHYCVWKFRFKDGHANCYSNYTSGAKAGQCVGPFGCP